MWTAVVLSLTLLPANPPASGVAEKLRQAAKMPTPGFAVNLGVGSNAKKMQPLIQGEEAITLMVNYQPPPPRPAAEIQRELKGDLSDGERYLDLALSLEDDGQSKEAQRKAVDLFQQRLQQKPNDPYLLGQLGRALAGTDDAKAELYLRHGLVAQPGDHELWNSLSGLLFRKIVFTLFGVQGKSAEEYSLAVIEKKLREEAVPPERLRAAMQFLEEYTRVLDGCAATQANQAQAYVQRAILRGLMENGLRLMLQALLGEPTSNFSMRSLWDNRAVADLDRAVAGGLQDPEVLGMAGYLDLLDDLGALAKPGGKKLLEHLPPDRRQRTLARLERLEQIAGTASKQPASRAALLAGVLYFLLEEQERSLKMLRQAVTIDPTCEQAWYLYLRTYGDTKDLKGLLALSQDRLRAHPTARAHYYLAFAATETGALDLAETHARQSLQMDPKNPRAHFGLAAVLLRRDGRPETLQEAGQLLALGEQLADDKTEAHMKAQYLSLRAIHTGLTGDLTEARAQMLRAALLDGRRGAFESVQQALEEATAPAVPPPPPPEIAPES